MTPDILLSRGGADAVAAGKRILAGERRAFLREQTQPPTLNHFACSPNLAGLAGIEKVNA